MKIPPLEIQELIATHMRTPLSIIDFMAVGGGSINHSFRVVIDKKKVIFCKINSVLEFPLLFKKEQQGLEMLGAQKILRIPKVIAVFESGKYQVLLLEWIEEGLKSSGFWLRFGEQLASLHRISSPTFGFEDDNYMGALPQYNRPNKNWIDFFIEQRLVPQVKLARENKLLGIEEISLFEKLYSRLPQLFTSDPPALLHGDLWSGNFLCDLTGNPVLIDPAVYFGNRQVDLAMTRLFGGFESPFYQAYHYHYPLPSNHREQWEVCNLYPLLIHLNLFGKQYLQGILSTLKQF